RFEDMFQQSVNYPMRRETLCQKVEDDNESLMLTKIKFQDMLQDPKTLYKEILKLIMKLRDLLLRNNILLRGARRLASN
ncbi:hypothetical protein GP486_006495, partial [Trichoglossum hirsutum]